MKNSKLLLVFCLILGMATYFSSCEKKYDSEVVYKGTVINTVTQKPFANTEVKVTDGEHINVTVKTDESGQFSILVKFNEINGNYYILIGDASCVQVRREFKGFGQSEINLGEIEVEGPKVATITTKPVSNITAESAMSGGNITDDGRAEITARGVCWSKAEYPTISDSHTTNGTGKGNFESEIRGLESGVTYYVRAYATNSIGTVYGEQFKFSTETGFPTVTTDVVSNITATSVVCGGTVTNDSGYQITACGVCWSTQTSYPTITGSHTTDVIVSGHFNSVLENLERNTTYYVRAYTTNQYGTSYGETITFTTILGIPVVKTGDVCNILASSAKCTGKIESNSGYSITKCGLCWSDSNTNPTLDGSHSIENAISDTFISNITDLKPSTTYYVRAYATNMYGTGYGASQKFTTDSGLPVVATGTISNIQASSAVCTGKIESNSGYSIKSCGVCWSPTNSSPTINDCYTMENVMPSTYSSTMTNLEHNTTYYVRAYATNVYGTSYGETKIFSTISGLPVVSTGVVSDISATSAGCTGEVINNSGFAITARGFCWSSINTTPTINDSHSTNGSGIGSFSGVLSELNNGTKYYVRAYATNSKGTSYGSATVFTTLSGLPVVSTIAVGENMTMNTITTGGQILDDGGYPITLRGVVWGRRENPIIEHNEYTSDGNGSGSYVSKITGVDLSTNIYYIRSYATNRNGTSYGEQIVVTPDDYKYASLNTMQLNGYYYKIYVINERMTWYDASEYINHLLVGGYSDWMLPNETEALTVAQMGINPDGWFWLNEEHKICFIYNGRWRVGGESPSGIKWGSIAIRKYVP